MDTRIVDLNKEDTDLKELLRQVAATGEEILVVDKGDLLVRVLPAKTRTPGLLAGKIWMSEDFDEPLSDDFCLGKDENPT